MERPSRPLQRGVAAATALLVAAATALVALSPQSRSLVAAVGAAGTQAGTDWLVVVAVLWIADRLVGPADLDGAMVWRVAALVFAGALAVELTPLVAEAGREIDAAAVDRAVDAARAALFPAGAVLGVGLGAVTLCDFGRPERETAIPLAPIEGFASDDAPAAFWRLGRVLVFVATLSVGLALLATLTVAPARYFALALVEATVEALAAFVAHLPVGAALLALLVAGAGVRTLVGATVGVWTVTFLLGLGVGVVARLLGVAAVALTVTPIPAVDSAALVTWPDPFSWDALTTAAAVLAAGVGLWTMQERLGSETHSGVGAERSESGGPDR